MIQNAFGSRLLPLLGLTRGQCTEKNSLLSLVDREFSRPLYWPSAALVVNSSVGGAELKRLSSVSKQQDQAPVVIEVQCWEDDESEGEGSCRSSSSGPLRHSSSWQSSGSEAGLFTETKLPTYGSAETDAADAPQQQQQQQQLQPLPSEKEAEHAGSGGLAVCAARDSSSSNDSSNTAANCSSLTAAAAVPSLIPASAGITAVESIEQQATAVQPQSAAAPAADDTTTEAALLLAAADAASALQEQQQLLSAAVETAHAAVPAAVTCSVGPAVCAAIDGSSSAAADCSGAAADCSSLTAAAAAAPSPVPASAGGTAEETVKQQQVAALQSQSAAAPAAADATSPTLSSLQWSFGSSSSQNGRSHMEDRLLTADLTGQPAFSGAQRAVLVAVFDGHGGEETAEYLAGNMVQHILAQGPAALQEQPGVVLERAVLAAETEVLSAWNPDSSSSGGGSKHASGSTLCLLLLADNVMHVAHVGDSRAVLARGGKAVTLTEDHKASSAAEALRISTAHPGAHVSSDGYLYGELGVSRGIGSAHLKCNPDRRAFVAQPDVTSMPVNNSSDDFVVLATDGVWDTVGAADAVAAVRRSLAVSKDAAAAAGVLVERAVKMGSQDNASAVVLLLHGRDIVLPKSNSRLFSRRGTAGGAAGEGSAAEGVAAAAVTAAQ